MPCSNKKARLLLKEGKAKVIGYKPFTIQLLQATGESTQKINLGVDTGAVHIGIAATSGNKVLVKGEIELRDDVHKNMQSRALLRRTRRVRNLRHRQPRFLNRKKCDGWLPPTVQSKLDATFNWIDKINLLLPNTSLHIEVGKFDLLKMTEADNKYCKSNESPEYYNIRYYVLSRDNYTCQVCKKKNKMLQVHHIIYRSRGGTNRLNNLITVCSECHSSLNHKEGGILYDWMIKHKNVKQYKEATFMNIIRKRTIEKYPDADITYGYETSPNRKKLGLSKTHYNDAIAISKIKSFKENDDSWFYIKQYRKKKRSLHETHPIKYRNFKNTNSVRKTKNVPERFGWFMNDMVRFNGRVGWIYGFSGGEAGRACVVRDIFENVIKVDVTKSTPQVNFSKLKFICHNNNWQYVLLKN